MWLTDFRRQHGLKIYELAELIRIVGAKKTPELTVSEGLIWRLENETHFRTIPKLADMIAECCGATAEQRDELVLKKYRGKWTPPKDNRPRLPEKRQEKPGYKWGMNRPVVVIDPEGNEIRRHPSATLAAGWVGISPDSVDRRCNRDIDTWEFKMCKVSFRWADQYDAMTPEERTQDAARTKGGKGYKGACRATGKRGGATCAIPVTVIMPDGQARFFSSVSTAAEGMEIAVKTVWMGIKRGRPAQVGPVAGVRFMYTRDFEKLRIEN